MASISFKGGSKLKASLDDLSKRMTGKLDVGFFEGETYPDGTSLPVVAFLNEYGTTKIPARPFFRTMIAEKSGGWGDTLVGAAKHTNFNGPKALGILGNKMRDQLSESIRGWSTPDNAPSTIKKKGFNNPLIDTGQLLKAPKFKVSE